MLLRRSGRTSASSSPACHRQPKPRQAAPTGCTRSSTTAFASCRRDAAGVRLYIRNGNDFTKRFPLVVAAVATLPARSCLIDGEAIVSNESGLAVFQLLRSWPTNLSAVLCVFELLEFDGEDLHRLPIEVRKVGLAQLLLRKPSSDIAFNEHYVGDGEIIHQQAC
jgi:bifunctional non-homologous end joining protein LigD